MERTTEGATPPWYAAGLRFDCGRCGNCCSGPSGRVWFDREELLAMARFLGELPFEFRRKFTRSLDGRDSLAETAAPDGGFDCVFLVRDDQGRAGCRIHAVRPAQCRTFPFWREHLGSAERYAAVGASCLGVRRGLQHEGTLHSLASIEAARDATPS
jgi:Fe-S-cluster containining protein